MFRLYLPIDTQPTLDAATTIAERFTQSVDSVAAYIQPIHTIKPFDAIFFTIDTVKRLYARINNH